MTPTSPSLSSSRQAPAPAPNEMSAGRRRHHITASAALHRPTHRHADTPSRPHAHTPTRPRAHTPTRPLTTRTRSSQPRAPNTTTTARARAHAYARIYTRTPVATTTMHNDSFCEGFARLGEDQSPGRGLRFGGGGGGGISTLSTPLFSPLNAKISVQIGVLNQWRKWTRRFFAHLLVARAPLGGFLPCTPPKRAPLLRGAAPKEGGPSPRHAWNGCVVFEHLLVARHVFRRPLKLDPEIGALIRSNNSWRLLRILPPIRGSLPEVIRSWCAHHHHHQRSSPAV